MKLSRLLLFISGLSALSASAFEPFQVKDIRVEGIQRTEPGTVFTYLPVRVGETLTDEKAAAAIRSLYATGFFKDVRLEIENGVLVVVVEERPAIDQINFVGQKEFDKDKLKGALKDVGLSEGRILDRAVLQRAEQEILLHGIDGAGESFPDEVVLEQAPEPEVALFQMDQRKVPGQLPPDQGAVAPVPELRVKCAITDFAEFISRNPGLNDPDRLPENSVKVHPGFGVALTRIEVPSAKKSSGEAGVVLTAPLATGDTERDSEYCVANRATYTVSVAGTVIVCD